MAAIRDAVGTPASRRRPRKTLQTAAIRLRLHGDTRYLHAGQRQPLHRARSLLVAMAVAVSLRPRDVFPCLMSISMQREPDNTCVLTIRGTLRKRDLDSSQQALIEAMGSADTVRLLVILDGFDGWEPGGDWGDLSFYLSHGHRLDRIAI